jgi:hypothetical protein
VVEHLPGYDNWKTGGGMPHNENRTDPYDDEELEHRLCPACYGPLGYTGTLGRLDWFECRNCGMKWYGSAEPDPPGYDCMHPDM